MERISPFVKKTRTSVQGLQLPGRSKCRSKTRIVSIIYEVPRAELRFAKPIGDPNDLKRIIEKLTDKLCLDLEARGIGARRLGLVFVRVDNIARRLASVCRGPIDMP